MSMASVGTTYTSPAEANDNKITVHNGRIGVNRIHRQARAIQTIETDLISTDARRADQTKHLVRMGIPPIPKFSFSVLLFVCQKNVLFLYFQRCKIGHFSGVCHSNPFLSFGQKTIEKVQRDRD